MFSSPFSLSQLLSFLFSFISRRLILMQQRRTEVLLITNPFLSPPFCNSLLLLVCHIPESSTSSAMSGVTITILFTSLLSNLTITYSSSDPWSCDPCTAYAAVAPATNASVAADSTTAANNGAKKNICLTSFFYLFFVFLTSACSVYCILRFVSFQFSCESIFTFFKPGP